MKLVSVNEKRSEKDFLRLPLDLHADDPHYIHPLDTDIASVFDPAKNHLLKDGEAARWLVYSDDGKALGRVAAFISPHLAIRAEFPIGGMGFFESTNDFEVSRLLLHTVKDWLEERNYEGMDGPINFGERDRWWGLQIDGERRPLYGMFRHPAYYRSLLEDVGFKLYFKQFTYGRDVGSDMPELVQKVGKRWTQKEDFRFENINKRKLDKHAAEFSEVYNQAWGGSHEHFKLMSLKKATAIMKRLKPVLVEE
ncbi:hypothetical protein N8482_00875, partial [Chitinophagales bacterium]|nr:hypothetical protein [Chitinophagales bacterium]